MADETCTCTTLPDGTHYPACPASPYQAGIRSGRSQERAAIVAWMRAARVPHAQADAIERGDHLAKREARVVAETSPPWFDTCQTLDGATMAERARIDVEALLAERARLATDSGIKSELLEEIANGSTPPTRTSIQARHDEMWTEARKVVADPSPPLRPIRKETP